MNAKDKRIKETMKYLSTYLYAPKNETHAPKNITAGWRTKRVTRKLSKCLK